PEFRLRKIEAGERRQLRAPHGEAERDTPRMAAGEENTDRDEANRNRAGDQQRARREGGDPRARNQRDDNGDSRDARERHRKSAPRPEIGRREDRIPPAQGQKPRREEGS